MFPQDENETKREIAKRVGQEAGEQAKEDAKTSQAIMLMWARKQNLQSLDAVMLIQESIRQLQNQANEIEALVRESTERRLGVEEEAPVTSIPTIIIVNKPDDPPEDVYFVEEDDECG